MHAVHALRRERDTAEPAAPIRRAIETFDAARVRQAPDGDHAVRRAWPAVCALCALVLGVAGLVLADVASGYTVIRPGPVHAAGDLAGSHGTGTLLTTSVRVGTASPAELIASWLGDDSVVLRRVQPVRSTPEQFAAARMAAWVAAHRCVGLRPVADPPEVDSDLNGASGGLMMALANVETLRGRSLSGQRVAGTGVIASDGSLHRVENVAVKARAAEASGASLFLVPLPQAAEAEGAKMRVVGVRSLDDALRALGADGCSKG